MGISVLLSELYSCVFCTTFLYLVVAIFLIKLLVKYLRQLVWEWRKSKYPKDIVILHQFPRGYRIPNLSPFALKLETWLRIADIKYQNSFGYTFGPKGKIPFITYNGEDVPDSQFCIEYLSKKMNKDLSKDHSAKDLGAARAFMKMSEESLFWIMAFSRFVYDPNLRYAGIPKLMAMYIRRALKSRGKAQGYALHSKDELYSIGKQDLKALNEFLAGKKFLLGDKPCNEDAAVFGIVAQMVYTDTSSLNTFIKDECQNIVSFVENIKTTYWPDWDECIVRKNKKNN